MFDFHQKRKLRSVFHSRLTQIVLLVLSLFIFWSAYDRYLVAKEMSEKRLALEEEMINLQKRELSLDKEVEYLSSDRGIEAEMRRQFDIARDGEQVVIILEDDKATTATATKSKDVESRPWYKFW
ncbi:MAG: septum formation initiator family protein [Candidatus Pacebacteria bacterium]|nr:septum formation initiator family protein [Candidatus Paceibacterota bacterium]